MTLGERISQLRKARFWTQEQLAEKVGVHVKHVSRWETNRNRPSNPMLKNVSATLGMSIDELTMLEDPVSSASTTLQQPELLRQFQEIQEMEEEDRNAISRVLQAFIVKKKVEKALHI